MEIRGTILAVKLSLVLWRLAEWRTRFFLFFFAINSKLQAFSKDKITNNSVLTTLNMIFLMFSQCKVYNLNRSETEYHNFLKRTKHLEMIYSK